MAEDGARFHIAKGATDKVQIGTANGRGCKTNNRISGLFNLWFGDVIKTNIASSVPDESFHNVSSFGDVEEAS